MTDEHGSESQPVHEEVPGQEHQAETEAGVWSDDHPPVDDFADAGNVNEEAASVSQEATADSDETSMPPAAPSRSMLPLFAGIGGILLLGAVIYWQFGHSSPPPMMAPQASPKSSSSLSTASNTKSQAPTTLAPTTKKVEEGDITSLYKPANEPSSSASTETAPTTAMATTPEPTAPPAPAMPANPVPAAVAPAAPAPTVAVAPVADTRIDSLTVRMDGLEKSIQAAIQQLAQLNNMVAANQAMPPVSGQASPALEDRLNKIEQNLMQIEHNQTAKAPPVSMPAEAETSSETVAKPVSHHTKSTSHKHVSKKARSATHHNVPMAPMPVASSPSSSWVLRAATPSEAWVAADARSAELRHVQVGDTLSGIGQIHAIRQTPSGWEIDGATGTIR